MWYRPWQSIHFLHRVLRPNADLDSCRENGRSSGNWCTSRHYLLQKITEHQSRRPRHPRLTLLQAVVLLKRPRSLSGRSRYGLAIHKDVRYLQILQIKRAKRHIENDWSNGRVITLLNWLLIVAILTWTSGFWAPIGSQVRFVKFCSNKISIL